MTRHRTRVLFAPLADADIVTSQNLTARDIALHLDPERFSSTFFHDRPPDPRLVDRPDVRLLRLPHRLSSPRIVRELLQAAPERHHPDPLAKQFRQHAGKVSRQAAVALAGTVFLVLGGYLTSIRCPSSGPSSPGSPSSWSWGRRRDSWAR